MKKYFTLIIIILMLITNKISVSATSVPIGISPETLGFEEFTAWIMLMFGVHGDKDNPNTDYISDSDFLEYYNEEWKNTDLGRQGIHPDVTMHELYQSYLDNKYKLKINRNVYDSISQALKNVFNSMTVKQVAFQGVAEDGQYTKNSLTNQLDSIFASNFYLLNDTTNSRYNSWNNYWLSDTGQNITSAYYEITTQTDQQLSIYLYLTEYGTSTIDNNSISVYPTTGFNSIRRWSLTFYYNNPTYIGIGYLNNTRFTITNTLNELFRDDSVIGQIFIDAGIQSLIDSDTNTLITSYTDSTTADTIEVAIPSDVGRILTDVQDRVISVSQAISQAQAVVVDKTDSQAVSQAQASVATSVPEFQTYGLSELFPFCIPFDTIRFLQAFADDPTTPEFDIKLPTGSKDGQGNLVYYEQHVDLHFLDTAASIMRKIELVGFCVLLCKVTRNIMIRS